MRGGGFIFPNKFSNEPDEKDETTLLSFLWFGYAFIF